MNVSMWHVETFLGEEPFELFICHSAGNAVITSCSGPVRF